jgi:flagellin-like protein
MSEEGNSKTVMRSLDNRLNDKGSRGINRAVSPVIGVILMVAITVILAAVIGAFVLEIGDQQETAPNTSFDSEQYEWFHNQQYDKSSQFNLTRVRITHAGGDKIDYRNHRVSVNGNKTVFQHLKSSPGGDYLAPAPDKIKTLGTNDPVEFSSGQSMGILVYGGVAQNGDKMLAYEHIDSSYAFRLKGQDYAPSRPFISYQNNCGSRTDASTCSFVADREVNQLETDDRMAIVWTADSGGKDQTLFRYTVQ